MKQLNKFLSNKIVNSRPLKDNIFSDVQSDGSDSAEYRTIDFSEAKGKHKYGFIDLNDEDEYMTLICFNDPEDFEKLLGAEPGTFDELATLSVGESTTIDDGSSDGIYRRIW